MEDVDNIFGQDEIRDIDAFCSAAMAYWGELSADRRSLQLTPDSALYHHREKLNAFGDQSLHVNVYALAWRSIAAASEAAGFAAHMHYVTGGGVIERPQLVLARTAMLGAARVLYMLEAPELQAQQIRAAVLALAEARNISTMLKAWSDIPAVYDARFRSLEEASRMLKETAEAILTAANEKSRQHLTESELLKATLHHIKGGLPNAEREVMSFWNMASGVAHARSWTWSLRHDFNPSQVFVETWSIPVGFLLKAWELWNIRRECSNPPALPPEGWEPDRNRFTGARFGGSLAFSQES